MTTNSRVPIPTPKQVETLRVRSASLEAELTKASARRKKEATRARRGAQAACQEQVHFFNRHGVVVPFLSLTAGVRDAPVRSTEKRNRAPPLPPSPLFYHRGGSVMSLSFLLSIR